MEEELISVIVPVHNVGRYLWRCLQSIKNQTYSCLEIILVDDGSTDGSGLACDEYVATDSRARVIHQPNMGLWAARNMGQDVASGEYVFFPDADDFFHPDTVRLLHEAINYSGRKYPLSICNARKCSSNDQLCGISEIPHFSFLSKEDLLHALFVGRDNTFFAINQWNKLYRTTALHDMRSRCFSRAQDLDFQMRLFLRIDGAMLVDEKLYYWVQRPSSLSYTADAVLLRHECVTKMTYMNYLDLEHGQYQFRHYFLHSLFKRMVFYKNIAWKTDLQEEVFSQCKEYERQTLRDYLSCGHECLLSKILILIMIHCPPLTRFLMKLTHNR